ncbi:MAG: hypothetical protein H0V18_03085 [Pyrinomonadaceae bacterium]|nr:hypothetical protein [Pyrinomonadaceae bacterium]
MTSLKPMKTLLVLILLSLSAIPFTARGAQPRRQVNWHRLPRYHHINSPCSQRPAEQSSLIRKAQKNKYLIRRLEFIGNENIRDQVLRRRILLQEGNVFRRAVLVKSLANLSKFKKMIYPVRPRDVMVQLNDEEKTINVLMCFKERARRML